MSFLFSNAGLFLNSMTKYGINTPLRIAHFLGQLDHESKGFVKFKENLNYTPQGLLSTFGTSRISTENAYKYGRTSNQIANQETIANLVYGGNWGKINLGNINAGDGWKYKGRGIIMLTGRANYQKYKDYSGIDVVNNPELASRIDIAIDIAGWFWLTRNINFYADKNNTTEVTKKVNGGDKGLKERKHLFSSYKAQNITLELLKKKFRPVRQLRAKGWGSNTGFWSNFFSYKAPKNKKTNK